MASFGVVSALAVKLNFSGFMITNIEMPLCEPNMPDKPTPVLSTQSFRLARDYIGDLVKITMDRKIGTRHPKYGYVYPVNYGYVADVIAPDGEGLDAYYLGVTEPVDFAVGRCIAVIHRKDDDDDKLVVVPVGVELTDEEILEAIRFQERWFKSKVIRKYKKTKIQ